MPIDNVMQGIAPQHLRGKALWSMKCVLLQCRWRLAKQDAVATMCIVNGAGPASSMTLLRHRSGFKT